MTTSRTSPICLGFIGAGSMGQAAHLRNYAALDGCRVVALAELRPGLGAAVGRRYGVPRVYTHLGELLAQERESLDALVCIGPFTHHGSILPQVLATGLPVMTEKPMAGSLTVGRQLLDQNRAAGGRWYVGYHKRSDPAVMWARRQIEAWKASGEMGAMRYVRITMPPGDWIAGGFSGLVHSDEPYPVMQPDAAPAAMSAEEFQRFTDFVNYYIHQVNLLRHLLGEGYRVSWVDPGGTLLAGRSVSGVTGVIEMECYRNSVAWQEQALVCFEKGWIRIELPAPLTINRPGRVWAYSDPVGGKEPRCVEPQLPWIDAMRQQAMNFLRAVRQESTPLATADEALEDLEIARQWLDLGSAGERE
ncbi:MAG: Gfo/Idh/MocA family oxidoreductase [Phycisphaerae bacterium]|nr:Gfo/Idh/MocA family oxidoreductase [Phycisphaerae bacterium]